MRARTATVLVLVVAAAAIFAAACKSEKRAATTSPATGGDGGSAGAAVEVTLYTSVDQPVAEPIVRAFERRAGVRVRLVTDTEATKSAGLAARLLAERANPQADVFWGNEVFHTINLARNGALAAYESPEAKSIPDRYKDAKHLWAGTCLRARVIATAEAAAAEAATAEPGAGGGGDKPRWAAHVEALTDPGLKHRVALARPTAGTTGGHVSALYAAWGRDKADAFFRGLHANGAKVLGGNSVVAEQVGQGQMLAGLTDNDDVAAAQRAGGRLALNLPDQGDGELGTLTIPCTVALVAGRPGGGDGAAARLADYLLSGEVEQKLIEAKFGRYSVRATGGQAVRTMDVTYEKVADHMAWAPNRAAALLEGREPREPNRDP
jgi:iron(III) transport system substrate-binding protein